MTGAQRQAERDIVVGAVRVHGLLVDDQTRCVHYCGDRDVIAIRFVCCDRYFPCFACHAAVADHAPRRWPAHERHARAVLCGVCAHELTIGEYLPVEACPRCAAAFNPGCRLHHDLYFA